MRKLVLTTYCLVAAVLANAQTPELKWSKSMGGTQNDVGTAIAIENGNVYTTGHFSGTADFA